MTIDRAARQFRAEMRRLGAQGIGVTLHRPGEEPVALNDPKEEEVTTAPAELAPRLFDTTPYGKNLPSPSGGSIAIAGKGTIRSQLFMGDDVTVQIIDAAGEIVASYDGTCTSVAFVHHDATENTGEWVERAHKIKLGD